MEALEELQKEVENLGKSNKYLLNRIELYENGDAKLYYAMQRKMTEMANILNKYSLENVEIEDKNSKTFERITAILEKAEKISSTASGLAIIAGITGDEKIDTTKIKKPYSPESVADEIGELAGRKNNTHV